MPNTEKAAKGKKKAAPQPWYMSWLLAIPKNLVYFFVLIILFAFAAVCWIAYYEKDLQAFIEYDRGSEVVIVDPVFNALYHGMDIDRYEIQVVGADLPSGQIVRNYVRTNKPVMIKNYA